MLKVWWGKLIGESWYPKLNMIGLDGFETWFYFGSKYGSTILTSYWIIMFVFHFQIDFVFHIDAKISIKIQDLVLNVEFDICVHKIDVCYLLKVNIFHFEMAFL